MQKSMQSLEFLHPGPLQSSAAPLEVTRELCRELPAHTSLSLALTPGFTPPVVPQMNRGRIQICFKFPLTAFWEQSFFLARGLRPKVSTRSLPGWIRTQRLAHSLENWSFPRLPGPQSTRDPTPPGETYRRQDVVPLVLLPAENKELGFWKHPGPCCSTSDEQLPCALCS